MLPSLAGLLVVLLLLPASASAAPRVQHLKFRSGPMIIKPGQNTISLDGRRAEAEAPGLDRRLSSQPRARRRDDPPRRRAPPPPRRVAHQRPADVRGRRGEDERPAAEGLRLAQRAGRPLGSQPHDPQPPARTGIGCTSPTSSTSSRTRPRPRSGIRRVNTRWLDVEGGKAYPVFDVHRGSGRNGRFTYPDDAPDAYAGGVPRNQTLIQRDGVLVQTRRPSAPRRPLHRPEAHARRPHREPVPLARQVLGAGGRGVVGRGDDGDAARTGGSRSSVATC